MLSITSCPSCGSKNIKQVCRDWTEQFQGTAYTVPALEFRECLDCGEKVYDRQAMQKIEAHSPAFAKRRTKEKMPMM